MDTKGPGIELSKTEWGGKTYPLLKLDDDCSFLMEWNGKKFYGCGEAGDEPSFLVACDSNPSSDNVNSKVAVFAGDGMYAHDVEFRRGDFGQQIIEIPDEWESKELRGKQRHDGIWCAVEEDADGEA